VRVAENPVMTFPIKKRITSAPIIDRTAALYIGETQVRATTNEGDLLIGIRWSEEQVYLAQNYSLDTKSAEMKDQMTICLEISLTRML